MDWNLLASFVNPDLINPSQIHQEHRKRNIRSKYDYLSIKIKIDQYEYVFSRFNLSRYLMACQVQTSIAVDIPRKIKEELVDSGKFSITQEELTQIVFRQMETYDNSSLFQNRYRLIQHFHLERIPLIFFISGTGFIGKSTLAFQLGERLNISTILQTDIINALTTNSDDHLGRSLWHTKHKDVNEFFDVYNKACEVVRAGIEGDIIKTLTDGKPLIVEGIHLNPEKYLKLCGRNSLVPLAGFDPEILGEETRGKKGFIIPVLITQKDEVIRTSIRTAIFGSPERRAMNLDVATIADYAVELQNRLIEKFPPQYRFEISDDISSVISAVHNKFLEFLEAYFSQQI